MTVLFPHLRSLGLLSLESEATMIDTNLPTGGFSYKVSETI